MRFWELLENFADSKVKGKSIEEGPQDFADMKLDGNKLQQSLDYFYTDHAPNKIGGRKEAGSLKGHNVVTFTKGSDTLMFLVDKDDRAVFYVAYSDLKDGVAVGNVRSNGTVRATEVYAYLVDRFGTLYSDSKQTPQGRKIWSDLAKFFPDIEVTDTGDRLQATKESIEENINENKIILYTDPNYYGAEPGDYKPTGSVVDIPINKLVGFEPDKKMDQPQSAKKLANIVSAIEQGKKMPPVWVRKYKNGYQVIDGHHRFWGHKKAGKTEIPAIVIPDQDIEVKDKVAENFADGEKPGRKGQAKRSGVDCSKSVTALRKIAKNSSGEKQRMAHWCANMKSGRKK